MDDEKRGFRGIWFPAEVWLDERLTALEKIILMEIDSLDNEDNCYASNEHLANFCHCSQSKVSKAISKLKTLGYIEVVSFDGRSRRLRSCLAFFTRQDGRKCYPDWQKMPERIVEENPRKEEKKERKKPAETFDSIIAERTDNPELVEALGEFVRMRTRIKKPLTNYALKLRLNTLWKLGKTDDERVAIVNQSVGACWQDFYELKDDSARHGTAQRGRENAEQAKAREIYERDFSGVRIEEFE